MHERARGKGRREFIESEDDKISSSLLHAHARAGRERRVSSCAHARTRKKGREGKSIGKEKGIFFSLSPSSPLLLTSSPSYARKRARNEETGRVRREREREEKNKEEGEEESETVRPRERGAREGGDGAEERRASLSD